MFLDKCDRCHTFKKCRGYNEMILCDECIADIKTDKNTQVNEVKTVKYKKTTIFDFIKEGE